MVITVTCPSCSASFPVDSNKVPAAGVNARCSSCRHVFRIERPAEPAQRPPVSAPPPPTFPPVEVPAPEPPPRFETPAEFEPPAPPAEKPLQEPDFGEVASSLDTGAPPAAEEGRAWIIEREERIDPGTLDIRPMETAQAAPFAPSFEVEPAPAPPPPAPEFPAPGVGSFTFGKRDPKDKARRLARVLVSDMIMYNPERHERALANGTLKQDFADEITRSWKEYVEQVGEEMATQNPFWADALNDVLAKGQKIF